jgi:hypothetical protein
MPDTALVNVQAAHRHFSAGCSTEAWRLMELKNRSPFQSDELKAVAFASLWHWIKRDDCDPKNIAVGYWLLSRVHTVLGESRPAIEFAKSCIDKSVALSQFYIGYAYEALARAHILDAGDSPSPEAAQALAHARQHTALLPDAEGKRLLLADLDALELLIHPDETKSDGAGNEDGRPS